MNIKVINHMLKSLYKKMIRKLNLTHDQLTALKDRLNTQNICSGHFVSGDKMCPNTTALAIKLGVKKLSNREVRGLLNEHGVSNSELWTFYFLFDLPAKFSKNFAEWAMSIFREAIAEIIKEESFHGFAISKS